MKGHLGPWRFLGALRPPRPPACRAQSGSFLRALGWKHKGKNRNQLLATSANFPLRNLPAQLTIGPHRGDSIRRRRQAVLPRLEPLCFQTQLPPTSRGGPGGRQPPPSPSVSPESQTLASPGTSMEGAGERMPASTSAHGTARAVPGKQCGAHSAAPEPAQDGSPDVTARLSLSPPGPNRRASRGRRLGQRSRGRAARAGPGQRREQCGHREGTRTSRHPPPPQSRSVPGKQSRWREQKGEGTAKLSAARSQVAPRNRSPRRRPFLAAHPFLARRPPALPPRPSGPQREGGGWMWARACGGAMGPGVWGAGGACK